MIGLAALVVIAGSATNALAKDSAGYVNVSGTVAQPGGNAISVELKNANGFTVGSSSYTTSAGDTEQKVSDSLKSNFSGVGLGAKKIKDKSDGTEVIKFYRKRNGGQDFNIDIVSNEGSITVDTKSFSGLAGTTSMDNSDIDISLGQAELTIFGEGFTNPQFEITGVDFGDNINVTGYSIFDDSTFFVNIVWDPSQVALGSEPVFVEGLDFGDAENPFEPVSLWVVDRFTFTPAPGPAMLAGFAGFTALRRRQRA
jgi:hypothetical protein